MRPHKDDEALVDVLDVLLRDGAIVRADVVVSVADIPLIGIKLTAAIAGMETMTEYGLFEAWDLEHRRTGLTRRQYYADRTERDETERIAVGATNRGGSAIERGEGQNRASEHAEDGDPDTGEQEASASGEREKSASGENGEPANEGNAGGKADR